MQQVLEQLLKWRKIETLLKVIIIIGFTMRIILPAWIKLANIFYFMAGISMIFMSIVIGQMIKTSKKYFICPNCGEKMKYLQYTGIFSTTLLDRQVCDECKIQSPLEEMYKET